MPTRKQRRRMLKERRHEYETVWVDADGNELDEPPDELASASEKSDRARRDGAKANTKATRQRGGRAVRVPQPPSWQRAAKRAGLIGVVIFVFIYIAGAKNGGHSAGSALLLAAIYTAIFIPFQYMLDRFMHNRWQRRAEQQGQKATARRR